ACFRSAREQRGDAARSPVLRRVGWRRAGGPSAKSGSSRRSILPLSASEIRELTWNAEVRAAQEGDGGLQIVLLLARDAQLLALDRNLYFQLAVLDGLHDFPRLFGGNALADRHDLSHGALGRGLD